MSWSRGGRSGHPRPGSGARAMRFGWVVIPWLVLGARSAGALSLTLTPASASVAPSATVFLDVVIAGLGDGVPPSLKLFDLDITFDSGVISFVGASFGLELGDPGLSEATTSASATSGVLDLVEVSFLSPGTLDLGQSPGFTLATLEFLALSPGTTALSFTQTDLGDSVAAPLTVDSALGSSVVVVPQPTSAVLLAAGFALLSWLRTRR